METTIGAHRGAGDSSSPQDSSAVTEPTLQSDVPTSATTDHPGATSAQLAAMTISDHPANTSPLVATTSDKPSMLATSDHQANTSTLVATTSEKPSMLATSNHQANTSTQPSMVATSALPAAVTISHHPAGTMSNIRTMYSTEKTRPDFLRQKIPEESTKIQHLANCGEGGAIVGEGLSTDPLRAKPKIKSGPLSNN
ncbi:hypothetical protein DY000_02020900 [Brassica cretica]|uniref:Uncharacterized protein n=1 Tax=Brassica cretica TaxID=69181 RepID=A0ABQ7ELI1_BRACR|nr:hypothetical protein DY000_02020900 [Brassica cretica]